MNDLCQIVVLSLENYDVDDNNHHNLNIFFSIFVVVEIFNCFSCKVHTVTNLIQIYYLFDSKCHAHKMP